MAFIEDTKSFGHTVLTVSEVLITCDLHKNKVLNVEFP